MYVQVPWGYFFYAEGFSGRYDDFFLGARLIWRVLRDPDGNNLVVHFHGTEQIFQYKR